MSAPAVEILPAWLRLCAGNAELLANYDLLRGTNLSRRGSPIYLMIDDATGKFDAVAQAFFDFCIDTFERLDWESKPASNHPIPTAL